MAYVANDQLGQLQTAAAAVSIGSNIAKLFGGGKSKAQKQAESMKRRASRAAGVFQSVANALSRFPPELENHVMGILNQVYSTGGDIVSAFRYAPRSVVDAYLASPFSGKKRAVAGHQEYISRVRSIYNETLPDEQWWTAYQSGGVPVPAPVAPTTPGVPVYQPQQFAPSYTPTPIKFETAAPITTQDITGGLPFNPMWLAIGGVALIVLMQQQRK